MTLLKSQHDLQETALLYTLMLITLTALSAVLLTPAGGGHSLDTKNTPTSTSTFPLEVIPKSKICKNRTNFPFILLLQTSDAFRYQQFRSSPKTQFTYLKHRTLTNYFENHSNDQLPGLNDTPNDWLM